MQRSTLHYSISKSGVLNYNSDSTHHSINGIFQYQFSSKKVAFSSMYSSKTNIINWVMSVPWLKSGSTGKYQHSVSEVPSGCALGNSLDLMLVFPCSPLLSSRYRLSITYVKHLVKYSLQVSCTWYSAVIQVSSTWYSVSVQCYRRPAPGTMIQTSSIWYSGTEVLQASRTWCHKSKDDILSEQNETLLTATILDNVFDILFLTC